MYLANVGAIKDDQEYWSKQGRKPYKLPKMQGRWNLAARGHQVSVYSNAIQKEFGFSQKFFFIFLEVGPWISNKVKERRSILFPV